MAGARWLWVAFIESTPKGPLRANCGIVKMPAARILEDESAPVAPIVGTLIRALSYVIWPTQDI